MTYSERFIRLILAIKGMKDDDSPAIQNHLSATHINILDLLLSDSGRCTAENSTIGQLARILRLTAPTVSVAMAQLERMGFVGKRNELQDDYRKAPRILTANGKEMIMKIASYRNGKVDALLSVLSADEQKSVVELLEKVMSANSI